MTFEEKTIKIYRELANRPERSGELREILNKLGITYINADISEFIRYFNKTDHIDASKISKSGIYITLTTIGQDYVNGYEEMKKIKSRNNELQSLQYSELKAKIEHLEKSMKQQEDFWTSTTKKNKAQLPLILSQRVLVWLAFGISIIHACIAIFNYFKN